MTLGDFTIMPNHVHGIIIIEKSTEMPELKFEAEENTRLAYALPNKQIASKHPRFRNQGKNSISAMVGSFKSAVTRRLHIAKIEFRWQTRFHDHIIRNSEEYVKISDYIRNNVYTWPYDKFYSKMH